MNRILIISRGSELVRVPMDKLVFIEADGNFSYIVTLDNRRLMLPFQLGEVEEMISSQLSSAEGTLVRLGRGLIVNLDFFYYTDVVRQKLILSDHAGCYHELKASREVLKKLKDYIQNQHMTSNGNY